MDRLFALLVTLLPHHLLSRIVYRVTRLENEGLQRFLIARFVRHFGLNMQEAVRPDPNDYPTLNALFTRALRVGARPIDDRTNVVTSPVDGRVSEVGHTQAGTLVQAKGKTYSVRSLLSACYDDAFEHGSFATLYLSPRDYHRIHMPLDGELLKTTYIPGRLFSVAPFCVDNISQLFARNERVVCLFDTRYGKLAMVLVGALNVSAIDTVWSRGITPRKPRRTFSTTPEDSVRLSKGAEMGRFNMGSTVIILTEQRLEFDPSIRDGESITLGRALGFISPD